MPVHGPNPAHAGPAVREFSPDSVNAERAHELYAAWKAIFENAKPAQPEAAHSPQESESSARQIDCAPSASNLSRDAADPGIESAPGPARMNASGEPAGLTVAPARAAPRAEKATWTAMPGAVAAEANCERPTEVAVQVHYVRTVDAPAGRESQAEAVTIVLHGEDVSIIVRDTGLSESEALRSAFQTARELTGRSTSLQQLTLNGRVLYQQERLTDLAPAGGVLFSC